MGRLSARRVVSISFAPGPHPTLSDVCKTRNEQAITYLAAGARAGVALAGAAVAGAGRHDGYRCGR